MAYTLFEKGHTISATDFNNDYYHVGQGDLLPRQGILLEETSGIYDLGSNAYRWNNVHVNNIELQTGGEVQHCMNLIAEHTLTATASSIEFTGLNGSVDEIYEINCNIKGYATGYSWCFLNGDSTTNNYGIQIIHVIDAATISERLTSITSLYIGRYKDDTTTGNYLQTNIFMYANNSQKLVLTKINENIGDTYIRGLKIYGQVWNNSATLTSMKFEGAFDPGTHIEIWAKR